MSNEEAAISRAEMWRLVDDSNKLWREAHERQTRAIQDMSLNMGLLLKRLEDHEEEDRKVHIRVHDIEEDNERLDKVTSKKFMLIVSLTAVGATWGLNQLAKLFTHL